jgi:hypothetical protein
MESIEKAIYDNEGSDKKVKLHQLNIVFESDY